MALLILSSVHQDYKIFRCLRLQQVELPAYDANLCRTLTSAYFWSQDATVSRLKAKEYRGDTGATRGGTTRGMGTWDEHNDETWSCAHAEISENKNTGLLHATADYQWGPGILFPCRHLFAFVNIKNIIIALRVGCHITRRCKISVCDHIPTDRPKEQHLLYFSSPLTQSKEIYYWYAC